MTKTALILGGSGRFGRHMTLALDAAGWTTHQFDRKSDNLTTAAQGVNVIVNGWNPSYEHWQVQVPKLTQQVIDAAQASGASVILPGNVYNFGADAPELLTPETPQAAQNPLGRIRIAMEQAYRASGVPIIILRAGDFIDTQPTGIWFDRVLTAKLHKGVFTYMGRWDAPHAWAYLPDLARAGVMLLEQRDRLDTFTDVTFPGYTLTGHDMAQAFERVLNRPLVQANFNWTLFHLLRPFWRLMRHVFEMRYLWSKPHRLDGARLNTLLPGFTPTPLEEALRSALPANVNPNQPVAAGTGGKIMA
ncbi:epimerase [Alisedimentitalea sp. MJ-SS2]|uniref:epimerase n=1 Tax=Aliisedimentitalea sp. MJ-SS2 TaxID=3049795 RepID=UPI0029085DBB|nr:epimerase [Alisedimentitalea sp. MJ-SS2]MDU8929573.1 epimerase [Alisedimentitalea sp. MJ-SS2]